MATENSLQGSFGQGSFLNLTERMNYDVDIVLCIDGTASMQPVIDLVKKNALALPDDILAEAKEQKKDIRSLRLRVIVFRDYRSDGEYAMEATEDFFQLLNGEDRELFRQCVESIIADGGGDEPEDGLEALAYAIRSEWTPASPGAKRRQIITVWSDASTHELGFGRGSAAYDPSLPKSFEELTEWWGDDEEDSPGYVDNNEKRLLLFTPEAPWWTTVRSNWNNVAFSPSIPGNGLKEQTYEEIIRLLVKTLSA